MSTEGGDVVLNLRSLLGQIAGAGGRRRPDPERAPRDAAQITLLQSDELDTAQTGLKVAQGAADRAGRAVAPAVRRGAAAGAGPAPAVAAHLRPRTDRRGPGRPARALLGRRIPVRSLASTASVEPSIEAAWDIFTPLLKEAATATIFYGVVAVAGALLAGRSRPATAIRRVLAPYARSLPVTYGALALVVLLVLWWAPTPALRNPITALILIVLLALGTEALRRQMVREHPDAVRPDPVGRMRYGATRAAAWAKDATASGTEAVRSARSGRSSEPATTRSPRSSGSGGYATRASSTARSSPRRSGGSWRSPAARRRRRRRRRSPPELSERRCRRRPAGWARPSRGPRPRPRPRRSGRSARAG